MCSARVASMSIFLFFGERTLRELDTVPLSTVPEGAQLISCHSEHYTGPVWDVGGMWIEQLAPAGQRQSIDWCQSHSWPCVILICNVAISLFSRSPSPFFHPFFPPLPFLFLLPCKDHLRDGYSWRLFETPPVRLRVQLPHTPESFVSTTDTQELAQSDTQVNTT